MNSRFQSLKAQFFTYIPTLVGLVVFQDQLETQITLRALMPTVGQENSLISLLTSNKSSSCLCSCQAIAEQNGAENNMIALHPHLLAYVRKELKKERNCSL